MIRDVVRYRRQVVENNLLRVFGNKSREELRVIMKNYYRNLTDLIIETMMINAMKMEDLNKRISYNNIEVFDYFYEKGKSVMLLTGHIGNWEWAVMSLDNRIKHNCYAIVKPLNNKYFEKYLSSLRTKFVPDRLIHFKTTIRDLIKHKNEKICCIILGDQRPTKNEIEHWGNFLGQDTPIYLGGEKLARMFDYAVVYMDIQRKRRGYYTVNFKIIAEDVKVLPELQVTNRYLELLEESINNNPDNWLWSHNRWKYNRYE